ncbi:MAG: glutamate--cysteine ligase [Kofleriaceae bacterium]|nr:glutamate--cysteine ligase [Myxococcales bacterium]MCB9565188.1 glutamate--cysteine ligase [Kofleriaceae bacterium]MCB9573325.1 glutamate--cysteine ligase [Kofleriaceae bacterium]
MHLVDESDAVPLTSIDELVAHFRDASKPRAAWRVGTEHELIGVRARPTHGAVGSAPPYDGPDGIGAVLARFAARGWQPVIEAGNTIALTCTDSQITIEPGGQLELAGPPLDDDRSFVAYLRGHVATLGTISGDLGLAWLSAGLRPFGGRADVPWMPKLRYDVMRGYMPKVGTLGLDMMLRTATVQVNLDYADGDDALAKLRCLFAVTPILTALYANSPIVDGKVSGWQSWRSRIWRDTDRDRAGLLPFVFDDGDIFRAYAEWALDVPMYFLYRGGTYRTVENLTFRRFMTEGLDGMRATRADWGLHLSTLFPEARMKTYLEVRGCDCGSLEMIAALAPLCRGLLYDADACAAATALTAGLTAAEREQLSDDVPRTGLATRVGDRTIGELARELVTIARAGLTRVAPTAVPLLAPVEQIAETGRTQADEMIAIWEETGGDPAKVIPRLALPGLGR